MKLNEKKLALEMRRKGNSLNEIASFLKVSKGSVSAWVKHIQLTSPQLKKVSLNGRSVASIEKRRLSRMQNEQQKRLKLMESAGNEINNISIEELKILGISLYWAEGGKTKNMVRVSNSDPAIIKLMMRFFREICLVDEKKFKVQIHTHSHLNVREAEDYWSKVTKIPNNQFFKTYTKPSKASLGKKDSLPFGTVQVYVCDTKLFLKIMGWIEKIKSITLS